MQFMLSMFSLQQDIYFENNFIHPFQASSMNIYIFGDIYAIQLRKLEGEQNKIAQCRVETYKYFNQ